MIKDLKILEKITEDIPKKGYYIDLEWEYDKGVFMHSYGPFAEEQKEVFLILLNKIDQMIYNYYSPVDYEDDEDDFICYRDPKNYNEKLRSSISEKDHTFITELESDIRHITISINGKLINNKVYYHDGKSPDEYKIEIISE